MLRCLGPGSEPEQLPVRTGLLGKEQRPVAAPARLPHALVPLTGDESATRHGAVVPVREVKLGGVEAHVRVIPLHPDELLPVEAEARHVVKVGARDNTLDLAAVDVDGHDIVLDLEGTVMSVVFLDGQHPWEMRIGAEAGVPQHGAFYEDLDIPCVRVQDAHGVVAVGEDDAVVGQHIVWGSAVLVDAVGDAVWRGEDLCDGVADNFD